MSFRPLRDDLSRRLNAVLSRRSPMSRRARAAWLAGGALFLLGPFFSHLHKAFHTDRPHGDWYSIYAIASHSCRTGELEADEDEPIVRTQRYPPISRPLLMLLALPPKPVSAVLSFVLFAALYAWSAAQVSRLFLRPAPDARWAGIGLACGLVLPYIWADLTAGNLTSVLLASVTGAYVLAERGRPFRGGMVLSIGIMLKMIPAVCLVYFVVRRRWRVVWGTAAGVLCLGLLPSLMIFGPGKLWDYHGYWYRTQFAEYTPMRTIDEPRECTYQNQAIVRTIVRLFTRTNAGSSADPFYLTVATPPRTVLKVSYAMIMGGAGAALLWWLWRNRGDDSACAARAGYAVCVGSMLWFSPWIGSYYFTLAMWPAVALLDHTLRHADDPAGTRWQRRVLWLWLAAMPALASRVLRALGVHAWSAGLLLLGLALARRGGGRTVGPTGDRPPCNPPSVG